MSQPFRGQSFMGQSFMGQSVMGQPLVVRPAAGAVRIGDAERDEAVSLLGDHYAAGRLSREELDERIDQAMQAKFTADLRPLFADLPGAATAADRPVSHLRAGPPAYAPLLALAPLLLVGLLVTAIVVGAPWVLWVFFWMFMCSGLWGRRHFGHYVHAQRQPPDYRR
jgi:hypothetical protein